MSRQWGKAFSANTCPLPPLSLRWWPCELGGQRLTNGSRKEPCQYSLPGMQEKWQANFVADFNRMLEQNARCTTPP
jgi:hypothetical protein